MVRVYDLKKVQGLEFLTCSVFREEENAPLLVINAATDLSTIDVHKMPSTTISIVTDEIFRLYQFLDSPHWRDTVKKQRERVDSLFTQFRSELVRMDEMVDKLKNDFAIPLRDARVHKIVDELNKEAAK